MTIGKVREQLLERTGIDISRTQLRRLETRGLFGSKRNSSGYRVYTDNEYKQIEYCMLLLELKVNDKYIIDENISAIERRVKQLRHVLSLLK